MRKASSSAAENDNAIVLARCQYIFWKCGGITDDVGRLFGFQSTSESACAIATMSKKIPCADRKS